MITKFLGPVNFGTILSPEALCPLAEPLPPDSIGAAGVESAGLTIEPTACLLEEEGCLRKRKAIKKRQKLWRNHPKLLGPGALIFVAKQL